MGARTERDAGRDDLLDALSLFAVITLCGLVLCSALWVVSELAGKLGAIRRVSRGLADLSSADVMIDRRMGIDHTGTCSCSQRWSGRE